MEGGGILCICLFDLFYGYLVHFVEIWCILWLFGISFPRFGMLCQEKSGNPATIEEKCNNDVTVCQDDVTEEVK
jgi:hypothetical protein